MEQVNLANESHKSYLEYDRLKWLFKGGETFDAYFTGNILNKLVTYKGGEAQPARKFDPMHEIGRITGKKPSRMSEAWFVGHGKKVLQEVLEEGEYTPINQDATRSKIETVFFTNELAKMANSKIYSVDIRLCYWSAGVKLGVIPERLDAYADRMSASKLIRNVLIGSLGKRQTVLKVVKGELVSFKEEVSDLNLLRLDIIDHVFYNLGARFACELGGGVGMFLTDCWFVKPDRVQRLCEMIHNEGYEYKVKPIDMKLVYKERKTTHVEWYDEDKEEEYKKTGNECSFTSFGEKNRME